MGRKSCTAQPEALEKGGAVAINLNKWRSNFYMKTIIHVGETVT